MIGAAVTLPSVVSLLKKYHVRPKKRFGQNFLAEAPTLHKIVATANLTPDDTVVEVGSGLGVMTAMLAAKCSRVIAIELDRDLHALSQKEFGDRENIIWKQGDILKESLSELGKKFGRVKVVGNIPYEITSPLLFKLLDDRPLILSATLLMQKEVAERIVAKPSTKAYGILSVLFQAFANCTKHFDVARTNFIPPPKVTSSVLQLTFDRKTRIEDETLFRSIVKAAFGKRRKTLRNALREYNTALEQAGIDPRRRPETLSVEEYLQLVDKVKNHC